MEAIKNTIEEALNKIRPYLEADGGNVKLVGVTDDLEVLLELEGACVSCPMSMMTMKAGIEDTIRKAVPNVKSVRAVNLAEHV
ncbi:MAG: NifU family protein [Bacteroidetes bacterium]|nr:MAG: NifU family protein [Bacteroidota bacterium]